MTDLGWDCIRVDIDGIRLGSEPGKHAYIFRFRYCRQSYHSRIAGKLLTRREPNQVDVERHNGFMEP